MTTLQTVLTEIDLDGIALFKKGKVRNLYDFGEQILIISSDRISAFDFILNNGIPGKGSVLTQISLFWFDYLKDICKNHLITADTNRYPESLQASRPTLENRSMMVKKTQPFPVECIVRGYIAGSGWKEYQKQGTVCGIPLPKGLQQAEKLPEPLFTPSIKAESGHDENITIETMEEMVGKDITQQLSQISVKLYKKASEYALQKGIIIADTKFEFGLINNEIILIDEALTPDSSRFWPKSTYQVGVSPVSLDKQIVRDYLEKSGWNKQPPIPDLPAEIIEKTAQAYADIQNVLCA